jgi:periplasmic protein TonB
VTTYMDPFDQLLDRTLRARSASAPPAGLEQRLLAHIDNEPVRSNAPRAGFFTTFDRVNVRRSSTSLWTAIVAHAAVFLTLFALASVRLLPHQPGKVELTAIHVPPALPQLEKMGGGGGQRGLTAATQGHLPRLAQEQILPPKAPPLLMPKLPVEPSVVVQPDLKMADNKMPDMGVPNSTLKGPFSAGNGNGSGIGSGSGNGIGPGSGGNTGGGPMHVGGSVLPPSVLFSVEPEFSEEARKAKFSGNVQVYLWVDEHGNPSHVQIVRGVGMGLDQKAVDAVRQYKFKPAMQNGKPVKVDLYVDVNFNIF